MPLLLGEKEQYPLYPLPPRAGRDACALDSRTMTAELDELKKILDSKTPLRHGGARRASSNLGYDGSPGGGTSYAMGGDRIPPHLEVHSIMKRFNSAGPSGVGVESPAGVLAFGLGSGGGGGVSNPADEITSALKSYDDAVAGAEANVEKLSVAMDSAEKELDAAFSRNGELSRAARSRKDAELGELRKILEAKERAIDSLRETLSATRRTLEGRISRAEEALGVRDAELRAMQQELVGVKGSRRSVESQLENEVNANRRLQDVATKVETAAKERERELAETMRQLTEEHAVVSAALRHERGGRENLRAELEEHKRRALELSEQLRKETELRKETQRKLDKYRRARVRDAETSKARAHSGADVDARLTGELERRLEAEQRSRAASEQWLHAELKTREDMEGLFVALRDIAMKKPDGDVKAVKDELAAMRAEKEQEMRFRREEFDVTHSRLVEDNRRLAAELSVLRATISDRVHGTAAAPAPPQPPAEEESPPPGWERHVVGPPLATVVPL